MTAESMPVSPVPSASRDSSLKIYSLHAGDIVDYPAATLGHMRRWGEVRVIPLILFFITGGESPFVVDTGGANPYEVKRKDGYTIRQTKKQPHGRAYERLGTGAPRWVADLDRLDIIRGDADLASKRYICPATLRGHRAYSSPREANSF